MTQEEFNNYKWSSKTKVTYNYKDTAFRFVPIEVNFEESFVSMQHPKKKEDSIRFYFDEIELYEII